MNRVLSLLVFLSIGNLVHSLKLLTNDDATGNGNDVWDEPDEWESDIQFSYKPKEGKCKNDGDFKMITSGDTWYTGDGLLADVDCETANGPPKADVLKYCKDATGKENDVHYDDVWTKWLEKYKNTKTIKQCVHVFAKLATMGNLKTGNTKVTAFDIKAADCAARTFKGPFAGTTTSDKGFFCYSTVGMSWVKNDPKVKNMDGEEFEIMTTGTFSLISLKQDNAEEKVLEVLSTIDRAGTRCGATYIQNITLQGKWVEEINGPQIQIRATPGVAKNEALQVNFGGSWQHAAKHLSYESVSEASAKRLILKLYGFMVSVSIDSHRIHDNGFVSSRFANFLNVNFGSIPTLPGLSIGGLLGRDSHKEAAQIPEGCGSISLLNHEKVKMFSQIHLEQ